MGCGVVADYGHIPAILKTPDLDLVALFDPNPEAVQRTASKFGVPAAFSDEEPFFDQPLDAVLVCSSAPAHKANVLAAAARGLHVLCEKPIAMDDADAMEMIEAMERAGKFLFTGFVYRFSHVALQMKKWVEEGVIGDVRSLRLAYLWNLHGRYVHSASGEWVESPYWRGRMLEGGPMVDCGVHQIDLARWWLGSEVGRATGLGAWVVDDYEAPDHVWVHLDHQCGAHTMVEMSFSYGHTVKDPAPLFTYELIGTGGVLRYDRNGWLLEARHGQGNLVVPGASEKNFDEMHLHFAQALISGDPGHMPSGRDGLIATQIARSATDDAIQNRYRSIS